MQEEKKSISQWKAFKTFMRRYLVFLLIIWVVVFWINKSLSIFAWANYLNSFFSINDQTFFTKPVSWNTLGEVKQQVMVSSLDNILEQKQKEDKWTYRFQFSLGDFSNAFDENKEEFKDNEPFKNWFREFSNVLNSIKNFENSKFIKQAGWYEAKKVFKVKKDTFSFAFDYLYKDKGYQIKFYDVQFANKDIYRTDIQKILDKSYVVLTSKKSIVLYVKKDKQKEEIVRYDIKKKKITHQFPNTVNKNFINFFSYFTQSFANRKQNYWVSDRNLWVVYPPQEK